MLILGITACEEAQEKELISIQEAQRSNDLNGINNGGGILNLPPWEKPEEPLERCYEFRIFSLTHNLGATYNYNSLEDCRREQYLRVFSCAADGSICYIDIECRLCR